MIHYWSIFRCHPLNCQWIYRKISMNMRYLNVNSVCMKWIYHICPNFIASRLKRILVKRLQFWKPSSVMNKSKSKWPNWRENWTKLKGESKWNFNEIDRIEQCVFLYFRFSDSMREEQKRYENIDLLLRDTNCQIKGFFEKKVRMNWQFEKKNTRSDLWFAIFSILHSSKNWKKTSTLISIEF